VPGWVGEFTRSSPASWSNFKPRQASTRAKTQALAQACGAQATAYWVGAVRRRAKPQNNSGSRRGSQWLAAWKRPVKTRRTSSLSAYRDRPSAIIALSCGHTEPLWYEIGLYRAAERATV